MNKRELLMLILAVAAGSVAGLWLMVAWAKLRR